MALADPAEMIDRISGLLDTGTGLRRAAELIQARGYNRFSGADLSGDDEPSGGISVAAAIAKIARDPDQLAAMDNVFAGWLVFTGAGTLAGAGDRIISRWETVAPGQQRDRAEITATMTACASALVTHVEGLLARAEALGGTGR